MTLHEIQLEFERIYAERYRYDDDMSGARLHALRTVAPALIEQGMREAIKLCDDSCSLTLDQHKALQRALKRRAKGA